jgi:hypothetical protein
MSTSAVFGSSKDRCMEVVTRETRYYISISFILASPVDSPQGMTRAIEQWFGACEVIESCRRLVL